jgi:hypothetical protein
MRFSLFSSMCRVTMKFFIQVVNPLMDSFGPTRSLGWWYLFIFFWVTNDLKPVTKHNLPIQRFQSKSVTLVSMDEKLWMKTHIQCSCMHKKILKGRPRGYAWWTLEWRMNEKLQNLWTVDYDVVFIRSHISFSKESEILKNKNKNKNFSRFLES